MKTARVYVDFNEMVAEDEVLLSKTDTKVNAATFHEGKPVAVYMDDADEHGRPDNLIADGVALPNRYGGWTSATKWILKIDHRGIRHESDELDREADTQAV